MKDPHSKLVAHNTKGNSLALFFTRGTSLKTWVSKGLFFREKLVYEKHIESGLFSKIYWVTYGVTDRSVYDKLLKEKAINSDIEILQIPRIFNSYLGNIIYSFLSPILHKTSLQNCSIFKSNQMDGSWSAIIAGKVHRGKSIVRSGYSLTRFLAAQENSKFKKFVFDKIENKVYKSCDLAFVTTMSDKEYLNNNYSPKEIEVVPNYIDTDIFYNKNLKRQNDKILFVGRLSSVKNLKHMLGAANLVGLDVELIGNGPLLKELKEYSKLLKIEVKFLGSVPNNRLSDMYNSFKYFALTSISEGMPKVLIEAMACGCVCIGTNVQGINEVIIDSTNGILATDTSVDAIYEALKKAKELSVIESEKLSSDAIKTVVDKFSLRSITSLENKLFTNKISHRN